ncbi:MAG: hypothetical protein AABZ74_06965 [Cyanobacteriota bacterium]
MIKLSIGDDFIESAKVLQNTDFLREQNPHLVNSFQRTTISRAYYGIFHLAKDFAYRFSDVLKVKKFSDTEDSIHGNLRIFYERTSLNLKKGIKEKEQFEIIADNLNTLRKTRNSCDYHASISYNLNSKTKQIISIMNETQEELKKLHLWLDTLESQIK